MALNVITWLWGDKYDQRDVLRLAYAVRKNLKAPHHFFLFADRFQFDMPHFVNVRSIHDRELTGPGCFCRLRMFDPQWQKQLGIHGKIISLDLDNVITGSLDPLFQNEDSFRILKGANSINPNPFTACVMMLKTGYHAEVWTDFTLEKAQALDNYAWPDDQNWILHKLPEAKGWQVGSRSGIYAFHKPGWSTGSALPIDARMVCFIGKRKPKQYENLPWVKQYWSEVA